MNEESGAYAPPDWMKAAQVADYFQVGINAVRAWAELPKGAMPVHYPPGNTQQWRVSREEVDEWMRSEPWR